jgi:valyl-tRNA synthetase
MNDSDATREATAPDAMEKRYDPATLEDRWYARWLAAGLFHADPRRAGEAYSIAIPPPNVTGVLHMGHALNNTFQDILLRWRRMQGRNAVWIPGTDHAGIATQNVVERALRQEGLTRDEIGREAFLERVWAWKQTHGDAIVNQLKKLGCACDWDRLRFTMDEGLSEAVAEVFVRLYDKGLIYRGHYIVNWCPRCRTALSDEESEHRAAKGKLWRLRYPIRKTGGDDTPEYVVVATTRPETMLGDTAIAVHPDDPRYRHLENATILLPIVGRELRLIRDEFVNPEFGTGAVKVTPAHDPNDFEMGRRHDLPSVNVMNEDGTMNEAAGVFAGMDRFECRKALLARLEADGLLDGSADHDLSIGHCYRCETVVEPRLSPQWFVRMQDLARPALAAVEDGRIRFTPARWTKVYQEWMNNIRDWCISRQIWWGHRIPVYTCAACRHEWAAKKAPTTCPQCGAGEWSQEEDVLDTWFSSWLWPFSALGWPEPTADLQRYYPTCDLVTASEIIFFWVARMVMAGLEFVGDIPFRNVYIHGTVRDDQGRKMSKSLGNVIDPLSIVETYSADALRFSLMMLASTGQDLFLSPDKFEIGRNFGTKLWNVARYIRMHGGPQPADPHQPFTAAALAPDDRHILWKLRETTCLCNDNLDKLRFSDAAHTLYDFVWGQFCDWYIEYSKTALYGDDPARKAAVLQTLHYVFSRALRLLHPVMPFVTEELWHAMGYGDPTRFLLQEPWPSADDESVLADWGVDAHSVDYVDRKHELIRAARALKADYGIAEPQEADYTVRAGSTENAAQLEADRPALTAALRARELRILDQTDPERVMPSAVGKLGTVFLSLAGLIDVAAEKAKLSEQAQRTAGDLAKVNAKLANIAFLTKAKPQAVEIQKKRKDDLIARQEKLERLLTTLNDMERDGSAPA